FLSALVWCWCIGLAIVAVVLGVEKVTGWAVPGADWWPFAIAGGVGLIVAALIALLTGPSRIDAAVAIDHAFHLNERLSTALTLPEDLRATPAGRALLADAVRHVGGLDLGEQFGLRVPRRAWVPLIPAALAVGLLFVPDLAQKTNRAQAENESVNKEVVAKVNKALNRKIATERQKLDKAKFAEADKLLAEIEKAADKLSKAPPTEKDKALVELNKLTDELKRRQEQLGNAEQINKQLQQLKQMASEGPADEFAKDLAKGDFQKAAQDLKQLQEKLASGKMTESEKKQLQEQLNEMKQQLEKLANLEQRKKQLEEARKNGGLTQEQYEQQMAKLNDQAKDLKKLQQMAQQLAQASQQMNQGDMKRAAEALGMCEQQLQDLAKQAQELESLESALADVQDAKNLMANDGMNQIGEQLDGANSLGMGNDNRGNGSGLGRGRGQGDRPEAPDRVAHYNTKVKQQYGKGKAILEGFAPPNKQTKGESLITEQEAVETATGIAAEALSNQKIPPNVKKHVLGYFDQIRKGD
ncbi:MAG: hypothetical protein IRY99_24475, partial [Isosphaeraceae bacterium]|nr:hypothetical protein [Isosphaeraceae bacterium]